MSHTSTIQAAPTAAFPVDAGAPVAVVRAAATVVPQPRRRRVVDDTERPHPRCNCRETWRHP